MAKEKSLAQTAADLLNELAGKAPAVAKKTAELGRMVAQKAPGVAKTVAEKAPASLKSVAGKAPAVAKKAACRHSSQGPYHHSDLHTYQINYRLCLCIFLA